jgi:GAF domain-containing protein
VTWILCAGRVSRHPARRKVGLEPGLVYDLGRTLPDAYFTDEPLIIEDWRGDPTFSAFRAEHASHVVASVSVSVLVEGRLWGRLIASDVKPRRFSGSETDIISSVADMLAKALERDQVAQAHAAVAAFGRSALACRDISATIERAVDVVTEVLNAPMGSVIPALDHPGRFVLVYGQGPIGLAAGQDYAVAPELIALHDTAEALAVPDWNTETRFTRVQTGLAAGVQATLSVSVLVDGRAWGRLSVFWGSPRQFSGADVDVIESIAHVLAAALERDRIETRLRRTAQDLQRALRIEPKPGGSGKTVWLELAGTPRPELSARPRRRVRHSGLPAQYLRVPGRRSDRPGDEAVAVARAQVREVSDGWRRPPLVQACPGQAATPTRAHPRRPAPTPDPAPPDG